MNERMRASLEKIRQLYDQTELPTQVGTATFVREQLSFAVSGRYFVEENFNNQPGFHLAFEIKANEIIDMPEDYDDVIGYEDVGFIINAGYFDDAPLYEDENENGAIVTPTMDIEGKVFELDYEGGYTLYIDTVEYDDIDHGQIKVLQWNDESKIIAFKFSVPFGVHDVVTGVVELVEDTGE